MDVGIEAISFYTPKYFLDMKALAAARGVEPEKFLDGIGQEKMAVPPPGEDPVTMGANAAEQVLKEVDLSTVRMLIFATESGVDQSKAAGIYVHRLLGLPSNCRVFEMKQACYAATAGVQLGARLVADQPEDRVLVVAADVARYGLGTPGEPTQGAGAAAILVSAKPQILALDREAGLHVEDVMDFWRPNGCDEALVDGKYSVRVYIRSLLAAWEDYARRSGRSFEDFARFCYHLPFTKMAEKAHFRLARAVAQREHSAEELHEQIADSLVYNRIIGNTYAASLYVALTSLLENSAADLSERRIALFSYGSGCMAELFSGRVMPGYREHLLRDVHRQMLQGREEIDYGTYERFYREYLPRDPSDWDFPEYETGRFRLVAIRDYKRVYEKV